MFYNSESLGQSFFFIKTRRREDHHDAGTEFVVSKCVICHQVAIQQRTRVQSLAKHKTQNKEHLLIFVLV